jgi:hypothetical protein
MNIKETGCEDVHWIYIPQDVIDCCACTSGFHKGIEILRRAAQKFTSHGRLLLWSKLSLELVAVKGFMLNGNVIMDDGFAIMWEDVIVSSFSLQENKRISLQTSVRIARHLKGIGWISGT